jgi:uncharacterized SAM-binding protein YcdF (DUF218 family)
MRRGRGGPFAWIFFALVASALGYASGLAWFAQTIPRAPEGAAQAVADGIVVLTGGPLRLREGLRLLAEGKGKKLLVSGVYRGVEVQELLRIARQSPDPVECCVELGYAADSTLGNARETSAWMEREGFRSLILVTANYHMRRSLLEFRRALPDIDIQPHPVFPEGFRIEAWWRWPGTFALVQGEYHKYLAAFVRPFLPLGGGDLPELAPGELP